MLYRDQAKKKLKGLNPEYFADFEKRVAGLSFADDNKDVKAPSMPKTSTPPADKVRFNSPDSAATPPSGTTKSDFKKPQVIIRSQKAHPR